MIARALLISVFVLVGCGDDDEPGGYPDSGDPYPDSARDGSNDTRADSPVPDTGMPDTATPDTGMPDAAEDADAMPDAMSDARPTETMCGDGADDDGDDLVDCVDSDCRGNTACGELERCADMDDNDDDGHVDCDDSECGGATVCGGALCPFDTVTLGSDGVYPDTEEAGHAFAGSCSTGASPERTYSFTATAEGDYYFVTTGLTARAIMFIRRDGCTGTEAACEVAASFNGTAEAVIHMNASETVVVFVESTSEATGSFLLMALEAT